jgi:hypothetical protein
MEVKTYTEFWNMEKKLYSIHDISLPVPIPLRTVGIFLAFGIPWMGLLALLGIPFAQPWHLLYLAPPVALAWFGSKPLLEGKNIFQFASSRANFSILESRFYDGLRVHESDEYVEYEAVLPVWQRTKD